MGEEAKEFNEIICGGINHFLTRGEQSISVRVILAPRRDHRAPSTDEDLAPQAQNKLPIGLAIGSEKK